MTNTEWKKVVRTLASKNVFNLGGGKEIHKYKGQYGYEYSLRANGCGTITVEWDLDNIKALLVD